MATFDPFYIDELIAARQAQHGGGRGAPPIVNGHRVGSSINRACIVLLTAQLQTFVEEVFYECADAHLPRLGQAAADTAFRRSYKRWGNPSASNIVSLFQRLGCEDVLAGLSWRNCTNVSVRRKLSDLNEIRNGIAHGAVQLRANDRNVSLSLVQVTAYREFCVSFSPRFTAHALAAVA